MYGVIQKVLFFLLYCSEVVRMLNFIQVSLPSALTAEKRLMYFDACLQTCGSFKIVPFFNFFLKILFIYLSFFLLLFIIILLGFHIRIGEKSWK